MEGEPERESTSERVNRRLHLVDAYSEQRDLSTTEAAAQLGVTERTVRRAIARGDLPATRQGGGYRIHRHDLSRYMARHERRSPSSELPPLELAPPDHYLAPLPTPLSSFIGREAIQANICRLLVDPSVRLVTLTGPGGVGKTRLSIAAAASISEQFADGVVFVALAAVTQRDQVIPTIAEALGIQEIAGRDRNAQVRAFLRERRLLLVLDNFEQIIDAAPDMAALAGAAPGVTMLVTSRAPLRVNGEHECQVPPMAVARQQATQDEVLASDAGQLFAARAREHQGAFASIGIRRR